jgi:hypothetical protein
MFTKSTVAQVAQPKPNEQKRDQYPTADQERCPTDSGRPRLFSQGSQLGSINKGYPDFPVDQKWRITNAIR